MAEDFRDLRGTTVDHVDLAGARLRKVNLTGAVIRMVDLSGAVIRDISLAGASIDGAELDGLTIDGVPIAPLIEAELTRRDPARALRRASDPAALRAAWSAVQHGWAPVYEQVAAMADGTADISVGDEWSFSETLRHLVFATDAWLGAIRGVPRPFHAWGMPFTELPEFIDDVDDIGIDPDAAPPYSDVIALRAERVAQVRDFLDTVSAEQLLQECAGPVWEHGERLTVLRCLWVILNEECEHLRFARRDIELIAGGAPLVDA